MSINDGGPAFPTTEHNYENPGGARQPGISLRDYFAAKAMAAIIACPDTVGSYTVICKSAYAAADCMIEARTVQP